MPKVPVETKNKFVQTRIRCSPYAPDSIHKGVQVLSDRSCQTAASVAPQISNLHFYALLEFIPYQAIVEDSIKELDLPRKACLHWKPTTFFEEAFLSSTDFDDLETYSLRSALKKRDSLASETVISRRSNTLKILKMQKEMVTQEVQTTLSVAPHVLDTDELANVFTEISIQTSITCVPEESISNLVPLLKANLLHTIDAYAAQTDEDEESAVADEPIEADPEPPETEVPEEPVLDETVDTDQGDESNEPNEPETDGEPETEGDGEAESEPEIEDSSEVGKENALVTQSGANIKSGCQCATKLLNSVAGKLKVQTSTLQLTPQIFSTGIPFEDRIMQVLNTTVAVLQTEMSQMVQILIDEDTCTTCPCTKPVKDTFTQALPQPSKQLSQKLQDDPRSCKCGANKFLKFTDETQMVPTKDEAINDPRSCKCSTNGNQDANTPVSDESVEQRICRCSKNEDENAASCAHENKEIREISLTRRSVDPTTHQTKIIKEDIVEETTKRITFNRDNEMVIEETIKTTTLRQGMPDQLKLQAKPCTCSREGEGEGEGADEDESAKVSKDAEGENESPEGNVENDEEPVDDEATLPAVTEESNVLTEGDSDITDAVPTRETEGEPEQTPEEASAPEAIGDYKGAKRYSNIECECHPREAGAAPPSLYSEVTPQVRGNNDSVLSFIPCVCSPDNATASTSQQVDNVRETYSCPETNIVTKISVKSGPSVPNIKEQVIRLSVVYKQGSTEPEIRTEELLTPGRQITIAPNKSPANCAGPVCLQFDRDDQDLRLLCECNKLVCAKRATTNLSNPLYNSNKANLDAEPGPCSTECPVHCTNPSTLPRPTIPPTPSNMAANTDIEITIAYTMGGGAAEKSSSQDEITKRSLTFMYEHDAIYNEPYFEALYDSPDLSMGVQTDLALGDKLESDSISSVGQEDPLAPCDSKTEMPWTKISLPAPGTYTIKSIKQVEPEEVFEEAVMEEPPEDQEETAEGEEPAEPPEEQPEPTPEPPAEEPEPPPVEEGGEEGAGEAEPAEEPSTDDAPLRKQPLLFEVEVFKANEPYMEGLYRAFPNSDEEDGGDCGNETEIPWKDILLPENCKIRKVKKTKKCICKNASANRELTEPNQRVPVGTEVHASASEPFNVTKEGEDDDRGSSFIINFKTSKKSPNKSEKVSELDDNKVEFTENQEIYFNPNFTDTQTDLGEALTATHSCGYVKSAEVQVPPAAPTAQTCCKKKPVKETSQSFVALPEQKQSENTQCVKTKVSLKREGDPDKVVTELLELTPGENTLDFQVPGENINIKLKVSTAGLKAVNAPESSKTEVSKKQDVCPAICKQPKLPSPMHIPDLNEECTCQPCSATAPEPVSPLPSQTKPTCSCSGPSQEPPSPSSPPTSTDRSPCACSVCESAPPTPPTVEPEQPKVMEIFSPAKCTCTDKVVQDTFKQDPVMAALDAYEAEMKPLKEALNQLQNKIRNLNMPEMKGCVCKTTLGGNTQQMPPQNMSQGQSYGPTTVRSRMQLEPGQSVRTTMRFKPQTSQSPQSPSFGGGQSPCPYFQQAALGPPRPAAPYGQLPSPMMGQPFQPYMASPPYYGPPGADPQQYFYGSSPSPQRSSMNSCVSKSSRHNRHSKDQGRGRHDRPKEDLAYQARNYGMYPDCRGRNYPEERTGYQDSYNNESSRRKSCKPCAKGTPSGSDFDSGGASDGEDQRPKRERSDHKVKRKHSSSHNKKQKSSHHKSGRRSSKTNTCAACMDSQESQSLRPGKALKTSPDEFLPTNNGSSNKKSNKHHCPPCVMPTASK